MPNTNNRPLEMKEIQKISFEILKYMAQVCEEQQLRYYLMYGTLIGAVRHKDYIPWDDDVDIMMPRPDYEKFLSWASSHKEEMAPYEIFNRQTNKDYIYGITRVSDSRFEIFKDNEKNCGMGVFIDVYPYDGLGNDKEEALSKLKKTRELCDIIIAMTRNDQSVPKQLNYKGRIVYKLKQIKQCILGINYYWRQFEMLRRGSDFDSSKYVGPLMWYFEKPEKVLFERVLFNDYKMLDFAGEKFRVPCGYDTVLRREYGDYMQLPPVEKRVYHHDYKAYKKD